MTWARIDDGFHAHPKIAGVSLAARGLFVTAISYSAHYLTDGRVPQSAMRGWARGHEGRRALRELLEAGLLAETPDGHDIHDYLDHNPSKAQLEDDRRRARERQERHRAKGRQAVLPWNGSETRDKRALAGMGRERGTTGSSQGGHPELPAVVDEVLERLYAVERFAANANPVEDPVRVANFISRFPSADPLEAAADAADWGRSSTWEIDDGVTSFAVAMRKQVERAAEKQAASGEQSVRERGHQALKTLLGEAG